MADRVGETDAFVPVLPVILEDSERLLVQSPLPFLAVDVPFETRVHKGLSETSVRFSP